MISLSLPQSRRKRLDSFSLRLGHLAVLYPPRLLSADKSRPPLGKGVENYRSAAPLPQGGGLCRPYGAAAWHAGEK